MTLGDYLYKALGPEHADEWQALRIEGARDFPMGFLVTLEETTSVGPDRCRDILGFGATRGVFLNETLTGFCGYRRQSLERIRHRAEIGPFFVTRPHQGQGAAKAMMSGVVAEARDSGVAQLELFVDTDNLRAIAFYEQQGFRRVATHRDSVRIEQQPRDDIFMTLRL